ncbi:MAG: UDP-N-acetylmuramate dehydrogenase [Porphyromonadaceae bacterium]|nr:UDP-N-acetylmuramate dehydrogenase [Porphyromonadaceae bacterium]
MKIEKDFSLKHHNTFGIDARADWFVTYDSVDDLRTLIRDEYFQECRYLHIGEGSNLLFLANFHGIVLRSGITGIEVLREDDKAVELRVGAGMVWDDFVAYCTERGYYGVENLSLIPGQVGSSAIQNIGAYGVEVERLITAVHTLHRRTGGERCFSREECAYAYRHSTFKEPEQADYIVTHVDFRLGRETSLSLEYADLKRYFSEHNTEPTLASVRQAVIEIRQRKLPDTQLLGNAGSYFMNPIVPATQAERLRSEYPQMPFYPLEDGRVKLAAGWLIDQCGLKGYRMGRAGVYQHQALVLVNHGGATGQEIASLAEYVQQAVFERFAVEIHPEVKYIS